jgi:hypothetical protein
MTQATLDDYEPQTTPRCRYCGRIFNSFKSLNLHITKKHFDKDVKPEETVYAQEGIEIERRGRYSILKITMATTLLRSLEALASKLNMPLDMMIFKLFITATGAGGLYIEEIMKKLVSEDKLEPEYIS